MPMIVIGHRIGVELRDFERQLCCALDQFRLNCRRRAADMLD
jgi:hypothetical protein